MLSNELIASDVPQILVEPILNLYKAGTSPQTISQSFNLSLDAVITFLSKQQSDPALNFLQTLESKSKDFRCSVSSRLMIDPVVASDGKVYDSKALQDWLKTSKVSPATGEVLSSSKPFPLIDLKERIKEFAKFSLSQLEPILRLNLDDESPIAFTAECLAVLISNGESVTRSLEKVSTLETSQLKRLVSSLIKFIAPESKSLLLIEMAPMEAFRSSVTELFIGLLEQRDHDTLTDEEFNCLIDLIKRPDPSYELINLAYKASWFTDRAQLTRLQEVLIAIGGTNDADLADLKLRSAELCVQDKDFDSARATLKELMHDPKNRRSLLAFYDKVGWMSEKVAYLEQTYASDFMALLAEGASNSLVECLDALLELFRLGLVMPDVKNYRRWKGKNPNQYRGDWFEHPERIYGYGLETSNLYWITIETGVSSTAVVPDHKFKPWISWVELPDGSLFIAGGSKDQGFTSGTSEAYVIEIPDFSIVRKPNMFTARWAHGCILSDDMIYMISGYNGVHVIQCERFNLKTETWEALPQIPNAVRCINAIEIEPIGDIYILGGYNDVSTYQDTIQVFNIEKLEWRTLTLKLEVKGYLIPCFKLNRDSTDIYFHQTGTLYKLDTTNEALTKNKTNSTVSTTEHFQGPSYYSQGKVFISKNTGEVQAYTIGEI